MLTSHAPGAVRLLASIILVCMALAILSVPYDALRTLEERVNDIACERHGGRFDLDRDCP